jgi:hypothetical protein
MKTCFSTVTGCPGARWNFLGRFACIAFVFGSTTSLSVAGFENDSVHTSRGSFVKPVQRNGSNAPHGSVAVHNPYVSGHRGEAMENPGYRGPLITPNRETVRNRNGSVQGLTNQTGAIRQQEVVPQTRELNPPSAVRPFGVPGQRPQRDSAEINGQKSEIRAQHPSPNPADSEARASINEKFQRYENRFASDPRMSDERRERLNRTRAFFVNLIDFGYAPLTVDSWCDDLLDNQVDDGMPMDLVDTYWGQPVETQEFVEYDVPYELYTYRSDDGNYHQVTYKDSVVAQPTPNVTDALTQ